MSAVRDNFRLVLDTNIVLRGLINRDSMSGQLLTAAEKRIVLPLLSRSLMREYRQVLTDLRIRSRYPVLTLSRVELVLRRLRYLGEVVSTSSVRFEFSRDPKDSMLLELAIAGRATHLCTTDNDLLGLIAGRSDAARRCRQRAPRLQILPPESLWAQVCEIA